MNLLMDLQESRLWSLLFLILIVLVIIWFIRHI